MPVVFEEENAQLSNINASTSRYGQNPAGARPSDSPTTKFAMVTFALLCLIGAYYVPTLINPPHKQEVIYIEDLTEARMRLIPPDEQAAFLRGLPSRNADVSANK